MPTKPKPHTHVASGSLDDRQDGFRIDVRAIVSVMSNVLDVAAFLLALYCGLIFTALVGATVATKEGVTWKGYVMLPIFFLPYLVLADLIVRFAS